MHRFFEEEVKGLSPGDHFVLIGENHEHISKSLRMRQGEGLILCDGHNQDYHAVIEQLEKKQTLVLLQSVKTNTAESPYRVTLYQGMPKGQKMDLIVQKSVELGVHSIVPLYTNRSIPKGSDKEKKGIRWNKIALEAAKQSGRGLLPHVEEGLTWEEFFPRISQVDLCLVAYEGQREKALNELLMRKPRPQSVAILIGPEGGFDGDEIQKLKEHGVYSVELGPRILRTETAGMVLLSMMMYQWELALGGTT